MKMFALPYVKLIRFFAESNLIQLGSFERGIFIEIRVCLWNEQKHPENNLWSLKSRFFQLLSTIMMWVVYLMDDWCLVYFTDRTQAFIKFLYKLLTFCHRSVLKILSPTEISSRFSSTTIVASLTVSTRSDNIMLEKINIRKSLLPYKFLHTLQLNKDGRKIMILIKQTELQTFNFLKQKLEKRENYCFRKSKGCVLS